jgi:hypothetical protein
MSMMFWNIVARTPATISTRLIDDEVKQRRNIIHTGG